MKRSGKYQDVTTELPGMLVVEPKIQNVEPLNKESFKLKKQVTGRPKYSRNSSLIMNSSVLCKGSDEVFTCVSLQSK